MTESINNTMIERMKLCAPSLFFVWVFFFDVVFIILFLITSRKDHMRKKIKIFILLCLGGLGWSVIINGICSYNQRAAWIITALPIILPVALFLVFKKHW